MLGVFGRVRGLYRKRLSGTRPRLSTVKVASQIRTDSSTSPVSNLLCRTITTTRLDVPRRATPQGYVASSRPVTYLLIASQCHRRWCARIPSLCRTSTHSHWPTKAIVQMEYYCFPRTKSSTVNTVRENKIDTRHDLDTSGALVVCVSVTIEFKWNSISSSSRCQHHN